MNDIIFAAINLGIAVAFFVLGKYVFPKIPKTITDKLFELGQMAEKMHWKTMRMEQSMHMTNKGKRWEPLQKRWRNRLPQTSL